MTGICRFCGVLPEFGHMDWCKVDRAPTAKEVAEAVVSEQERSVDEGLSSGLVAMAQAFLFHVK